MLLEPLRCNKCSHAVLDRPISRADQKRFLKSSSHQNVIISSTPQSKRSKLHCKSFSNLLFNYRDLGSRLFEIRTTSIEKARRKWKVVDNVSNTTTYFVFVLMRLLGLFVLWVRLLIEHVGQTIALRYLCVYQNKKLQKVATWYFFSTSFLFRPIPRVTLCEGNDP